MRDDGSGVIRLQMFATDGTILYSDLASKRGEAFDLAAEDHLVAALQGKTEHEVSDLEGPENGELKEHYHQALEVYQPIDFGGDVVGVYEVYQDLGPARTIRPLVWGSVLGGFALLLVALLGVVRTAAILIRRQQQALSHHAFFDRQTDLPNRALFVDRVDAALARQASRPKAIVLVYAGGVNLVNDSLGHAAGDGLMLAVARRLTACVGPDDTLARLNNKKFGILLTDASDAAHAIRYATDILDALRAPLAVDGRELFATPCIGIAVSTAETGSAEALLRDADTALSRARVRDKDGYVMFDTTMLNHAAERLTLETDLRRALDRAEFCLHYQPILSLRDGQVLEVEALVRWNHPERGLIGPDLFIPVAEDTGLIIALVQWILEEACRQAAAWHAEFGDRAPTMGVNLSARQFQQPELLAGIRRALRMARLDPSALKLEITESVLMADAQSTVETLHSLKAFGIGLAVDDFGTGYSSLAYLKLFPVDTLKVDRSFVDGLGEDPQDTAIVHSVVALAKALGLSVTDEGIETETQRQHLRDLGCERGQGYLFARPCSAADLGPLLRASLSTSSTPRLRAA